jgi:glucose/arabinose dehydrogenase
VLSFNFSVKERTFDQKKIIWTLPTCVPVAELGQDFPNITPNNRQNQPNISQAGGRLALLKNGNLLFSVGNFGDAWMKDSKILASIRSTNSFFGKILELQVSSKTSKIISNGHRNVQGLIVSLNGRIFASEHGPEGGDELNLIRQGSFYGWPIKSLGHDYSDESGFFTAWGQLDEVPYTKLQSPVLSWVPSIAPSQMIEVSASLAPKWKGDLLMGTLRDQSLRRLRVEKDCIILDERIPLNFRIRDLVQVGKYLYLLDDVGQVKRIEFVTRQK